MHFCDYNGVQWARILPKETWHLIAASVEFQSCLINMQFQITISVPITTMQNIIEKVFGT